MNLRIALFTGNYNHVIDGVALTLNRLVQYLETRGHRILVFAPTSSDPPIRQHGLFMSVPSVSIPGRPEYRVARGLPHTHRRKLTLFDPHLIHLATPDVLGMTALRWARAHGIPAVSSYHTHFPTYLDYYHLSVLEKPILRYLRWFYSQCAQVYVPTPPLMSFLQQAGIQSTLRLWGRGVDIDRFNPRWYSEAWRRQHGVGPAEILVTYVGRLVKEKGIGIFARVLKALQATDSRVRGLIVGEGPLRSELASELPGTIFTGLLRGNDLSHAYASSDVFLYPSDSEAFGNVIVEAMASGLAVVCAGSSGSSSHVVSGKTGFLAPPGNADAFLAFTRRLIQEPDLRHQMSEHAHARAATYSWKQTLATMETYYDEVLHAHPDRVGLTYFPTSPYATAMH